MHYVIFPSEMHDRRCQLGVPAPTHARKLLQLLILSASCDIDPCAQDQLQLLLPALPQTLACMQLRHLNTVQPGQLSVQ
jgi:hypothetical protein